MHVHVIMHDLPHLPYCITEPMHQCMFMVFKQYKKTNKHQRDKTNEAKQKQRNRILKIDKPSKIETKICKEKQRKNKQ